MTILEKATERPYHRIRKGWYRGLNYMIKVNNLGYLWRDLHRLKWCEELKLVRHYDFS